MRLKVEKEDEKRARGTHDSGGREKRELFTESMGLIQF